VVDVVALQSKIKIISSKQLQEDDRNPDLNIKTRYILEERKRRHKEEGKNQIIDRKKEGENQITSSR